VQELAAPFAAAKSVEVHRLIRLSYRDADGSSERELEREVLRLCREEAQRMLIFASYLAAERAVQQQRSWMPCVRRSSCQ
jgi:hypothetical protein